MHGQRATIQIVLFLSPYQRFVLLLLIKQTNKQTNTKFCYQFLIRKRDYETFACLYVYVLHAHLVLTEVRRGCQLPWSWVTDNWEPPCGCNKQNKAPLQKH